MLERPRHHAGVLQLSDADNVHRDPGGGTTYSYDANGQRTTGASYDARGA